jgi:hypothetical protein
MPKGLGRALGYFGLLWLRHGTATFNLIQRKPTQMPPSARFDLLPCQSTLMRAMDVVNDFKHHQLDLTQPSVRIIDLLPQQPNGNIRCKVRLILLKARFQLTAVSYEWGSPHSEKHKIYINERSFEIHHNLFTLLTSLLKLHPNDGYENLWIDALCIDQQNNQEKNHQVQQMKQIYQMATNVLVWLGPAADGSDQLCDFLNDFDIPDSAENMALSVAQMSKEQLKSSQNKILYAGIDVWKACEAFSRRTYWTRTWILQELLLAQWLVLICGYKKIRWQPWAIVLDTLGRANSLTGSWAPTLAESSANFICQQWFSNIDGTPSDSLIKLVLRFHQSNCSDMHDKVYGLLGLASDASSLQVDYNCRIDELFLDLLALLNPTVTITDVHELCKFFRVELSDIKLQLAPPFLENRPGAESGRALRLNTSNNTFLSDIAPAQGHDKMKWRWKYRMTHSSLDWKTTELYHLGKYNRLFSGDVSLALRANSGGLLKCTCCTCCHGTPFNATSLHHFNTLQSFTANDKVQEIRGSRAALFYRELDGKYMYMATGVQAPTARHILLLFHDPSVLEYAESTQSVRATLAQTFNLIVHQHLPVSAPSDRSLGGVGADFEDGKTVPSTLGHS